MKRILVGIFCILSVTSVFAQKTEDMYVMRHSEEGQLYFIRPNQFYSTDSKAELSYDITYLNTRDTASVKMTIYETTLVNVDSVALVSNGARFLCDDVASIYKEKDNKRWVHRCDCSFAYNELKLAMTAGQAPTVIVYTNKSTLSYSMVANKWTKLRPRFSDIFTLIDESKRK
jgi:hypothetical protein